MEYPGAIYQVMSRGDRREPIVKDRADPLQFLETLEKLVWERLAVACVLFDANPKPQNPPQFPRRVVAWACLNVVKKILQTFPCTPGRNA